MEKLLTSLQKKQYALDHGLDDYKEIDLLHEKEIMMRNKRRCMSFRIARPNLEQAWDIRENDPEYEG